jgi:ribosomal protein S27E
MNDNSMNTNRCGNCGGEQIILGRSIKCFDCGLCHGDDPTTDGAKVAVANDVLDFGHSIHVPNDDLPDDVFEYKRFDGIHRVRCTTMVAGEKYRDDAPAPVVPGIHPSFYDGVDEVGVLFVDRGEVVRYEACPYIERTHTAGNQTGGASA